MAIKNRHIAGPAQAYFRLALILAIILVVNMIASFWFYRVDFTSDKRYSLSLATREMTSQLKDVVYVKVYLEGDLPAGFLRLRNQTQEMLDEIRQYASGNIEYEFIDPYESPNKKAQNELFQSLYEKGLSPTDLEVRSKDGSSNKVIWPGAIISFRDKEKAVQILKSSTGASQEYMLNNSSQQLEYTFASAIHELTNLTPKRIAFIQGHGELDDLETADIVRSLSGSYGIERVMLNGNLEALKAFQLAVVAKPDSIFSEADKFILDQFIMKGGKVLWLLDGAFASMDSLKMTSTSFAVAQQNKLDDQLFRYGVRINHDLLMDMRALPIPLRTGMVGNQPKFDFFPWYYQPLLVPEGKVHSVVDHLDAIKTEFVSTIDTIAVPNVKKTFLLRSSKYAKTVTTPTRVSLNVLRMQPDQAQFYRSYLPVAVLLEGTFESVFKNRVVPISAEGEKYLVKSISSPTQQIVIADGDIVKNEVDRASKRILPLGFDRYTQKEYANKDFILNCVNYLTGQQALIASRSKDFKIRTLDLQKVEKEKTYWQMIALFVPMAMVLFVGWIHFLYRKKKYSS